VSEKLSEVELTAEQTKRAEKLYGWLLMFMGDPLAGSAREIIWLRDEVKRLGGLVYVPGLWRCAKCKFNLMRNTINLATGAVRADDSTKEKCPNCESPLWRVTERDAGNDMVDRCEQIAGQLQQQRDRVAALEAERVNLLELLRTGRECVSWIYNNMDRRRQEASLAKGKVNAWQVASLEALNSAPSPGSEPGSVAKGFERSIYECSIVGLRNLLELALSHVDLPALQISHQKDHALLAPFAPPLTWEKMRPSERCAITGCMRPLGDRSDMCEEHIEEGSALCRENEQPTSEPEAGGEAS